MRDVLIILLIVLVTIFSGCDKNQKNAGENSKSASHLASADAQAGRLVIRFEQQVDGHSLETDTLLYVNAAGNLYEISEIQWFASDLTLHNNDGSSVVLDPNHSSHYIDTDIPKSIVWEIRQPVPAGHYDAISFTFGIKGEKNKPYMFTDPPESDMLWPINLGGEQGGYHYMKMNGFWVDNKNDRTPFNFHLGVGQQHDEKGKIIGFIQNWFETILKDSEFNIEAGEKKEITIIMNIGNWFQNPYVYNHNLHGGKIMQNQKAMNMGKENGEKDVFILGGVKDIN